jgi:hypothetical protein
MSAIYSIPLNYNFEIPLSITIIITYYYHCHPLCKYNKYYIILSRRRLGNLDQIISPGEPHTIMSYYQFINGLPKTNSVTNEYINICHPPDYYMALLATYADTLAIEFTDIDNTFNEFPLKTFLIQPAEPPIIRNNENTYIPPMPHSTPTPIIWARPQYLQIIIIFSFTLSKLNHLITLHHLLRLGTHE